MPKKKQDTTNVKWVDIDDVKPLENNPRKNDKAVKQLAKLLDIYGQRTPINVWQKNMRIYKGNTTWKALKELGEKRVLVMFHDFKSDAEAMAYAISDNKAGEWSDWDDEILAELMKADDISELMDSKHTGFTEQQLEGLRLSTGELPDDLPDVDIQGITTGKSDFMVIEFDSKEQMQRFKSWLGVKLEESRAVPFKTLKPKLRGYGKRRKRNEV